MGEEEDVTVAAETPTPGTSGAGDPLPAPEWAALLPASLLPARALHPLPQPGDPRPGCPEGCQPLWGAPGPSRSLPEGPGETTAVRGTAANSANWGHCWVLGWGVKTYNRRRLLLVLRSIFGGWKWPGSIRPEGWLLPCRVRNTTGVTPRSAPGDAGEQLGAPGSRYGVTQTSGGPVTRGRADYG